jgi:hypothetical protein
LQFLQEPQTYNRAYVTVAENGDDIEHIRDLGAALKINLEKGGAYVIRSRFSERTSIRWRTPLMPFSAS